MTDNLDQEIAQELHKIKHKRAPISMERRWILDHTESLELKNETNALSVVGFHILTELIERDKTGIDLAAALDVTRGGITRAAQTLLKYKMIETYQVQEDKKKIFYHLTDKGQKVAQIHQEMHAQRRQQRRNQLFKNYSSAEKAVILRFLKNVTRLEDEGLPD